jgi:hypothetical protein
LRGEEKSVQYPLERELRSRAGNVSFRLCRPVSCLSANGQKQKDSFAPIQDIRAAGQRPIPPRATRTSTMTHAARELRR